MKSIVIFLFLFCIHAAFSGKPKAKPPPAKPSRPKTFTKEVTDLMSTFAKSNGYKKFDKCHIVHWDFMATITQSYLSGTVTKKQMTTFINDLAKIHTDASYYDELTGAMKTKLKTMTAKYKKDALNALASGDIGDLTKFLYNMPSNLYPGNLSNNRSIKNRLDPPKKEAATGGRSDDGTKISKYWYKTYKKLGLNIYPDPSSPTTRAKSSDKPPGDTSGDYVTVV